MKQMGQEARLNYIVEELKKDSGSFRDMEVRPRDRRRVMRSLMNIRMPGPLPAGFLEIQDEFLREEAREKGIVGLSDIPTVKEQYGSSALFGGRISIWQGDITRLQVDAIVNAANSRMLGCFVPCHGCIDNAIHSAAGLRLREACSRYMDDRRREDPDYEEPTGRAVLTPGFCLPCRYVIHTVGPVVGMRLTEELKQDLRNCYVSCLEAAADQGLRSIAFCCISTGEFHFPNDKGAEIAVDTVTKFMKQRETAFDRIVFNVFKDGDRELYEKLLS